MSFVNGDKSRNNRLRKKKIQLRMRTRKLMEGQSAAPVKPASTKQKSAK